MFFSEFNIDKFGEEIDFAAGVKVRYEILFCLLLLDRHGLNLDTKCLHIALFMRFVPDVLDFCSKSNWWDRNWLIDWRCHHLANVHAESPIR